MGLDDETMNNLCTVHTRFFGYLDVSVFSLFVPNLVVLNGIVRIHSLGVT